MSDSRFTLIAALYLFVSDYHSGQWSRGYRILSRISTAYRPTNLDNMRDDEEVMSVYSMLEERYKDKM